MVHTGSESINVAIVDDHGVVRAGLRLLLQRHEDLHVVGEAGDLADALRLAQTRRPDVLVLDLNLGGEWALDAMPDLLAAAPGMHVLVLTMLTDPAFARTALDAGADGYLLKDAVDTELVSAVRAVASGRVHLDPQVGARLARGIGTPAAEGLTQRETEVLKLIALGHTNPEIGEQLYLSVRTVESHRSSLMRKLGLRTRAQLVRHAMDTGLLAR